jgi:hypothetical protein
LVMGRGEAGGVSAGAEGERASKARVRAREPSFMRDDS